jgi:hypothetical protein
MTRREILLRVFREQRELPFAWGASDCLTTAAAFALEVTGRDPMPHLRGRYSSEHSAKRVMVDYGWADMADVARSMYEEIPRARAHDGDWVQVFGGPDGGDGLGVICGAQIVVRTVAGLGLVPLSRAGRAFRVS